MIKKEKRKMSTPLYMKPTQLEQISNSKISEGCALVFYLDGKLKMKLSDGSIRDASGGSDRFVISRPISDKALFPRIEASDTSNFESCFTIDPLTNSEDRQYLQVFNGSAWIEFPNDGLGTPFDRMEVSVDVSKFSSLSQPYYIRYCWTIVSGSNPEEGLDSNYRSSLFPSVSIGSSNNNSSNQSTTVGSNVVLSPTPPANPYDGLIWIEATSEDAEYFEINGLTVVKGSSLPVDAEDGTIFIQE